MAEKPEKIEGIIVKKGRKYYQIKLDTTKNNFLHKLDINEYSKDLKIGDHFKLYATPVWSASYNTGRAYISQYIPISEEDYRKEEIDRWFGYIKKNYKDGQGYIYKKGLEKLLELDAKEELKEVKKMHHTILHNEKVKHFMDYAHIYDKFLPDEYAYIMENGTDTEKQKAKEAYDQLQAKKNNNAEANKNNNNETPSKSNIKTFDIGAKDMNFLHINHIGDVFERYSEYYEVVEISKLKNTYSVYGEDGMSFGIMDDHFYTVKAKKADAHKIQAYKNRLAVGENLKNKNTLLRKTEATLRNAVERGAKIKYGTAWNSIHSDNDAIIWDTRNIYGLGEILYIHNDRIYLVHNNHSDGSNWSVNTVDGWGYGNSVPMNEKYNELIQKYITVSNDVAELQSRYDKNAL